MEHTVIESFQPDATLLKKKVEVLEGKVNVLKSSEEEPTEEAPSLLGVGSSEEGLKSQVSDLETRMGKMLSTTARLESEVNGVVSQVTGEEVLESEVNGDVSQVIGEEALESEVNGVVSQVTG